MAIKLVASPQYKNDRAKIMDSIVHFALANQSDPTPILKYFRNEESALQKRIKNSPLSA